MPDRDDKLAIAAAFHDIAAFDTLDYLVPSIEAQDAWLQQTGRQAWWSASSSSPVSCVQPTRWFARATTARIAEARLDVGALPPQVDTGIRCVLVDFA